MNTRSYITLSFLFLAFVLSNCSAQNISAEFMLLQNRYNNIKRFSVQMTYKAYKGHQSFEMADMQQGKFEMDDRYLRFEMGGIEVVQTGKYVIHIDRNLQEMEVMKTAAKWEPPVFGSFMRLDSLLRKHNAVSFKLEPSGLRLLTFDLKRSGEEYEKIEIRYLPGGEISSIILFYRSVSDSYGVEGAYKPRVEISYRSENFNPVFPENYFSEKKYFMFSGEKIIPAGLFKNYQIFNQP